MNQDAVKEALIALRPAKSDFTLVFSGKKNGRVNGLYRPASHEIVIHNGNFDSDNNLFFTAIHEYAHHIHNTEEGGVKGSNAHTNKFWAIFHDLLMIAEKTESYKNPARTEAFKDTTKTLQDLIAESGKIMCEIGRALIEAHALCNKEGARFDDYVMRVLKQTMPWARACIAATGMNLPESFGAENIKSVASIKNPDDRAKAVAGISGDLSPQQIAAARAAEREPQDVIERLRKESDRITKTIERLMVRQTEISQALENLGEEGQT